ncbi:MAG: proton-conducting transporter membrane subunit [Candidatus Binatia bacterium]|nr:proton-conducting transporter membrane subunit [Candidatus Binatia bacterium]
MLAAAVLTGFAVAALAPWCVQRLGTKWGPRVLLAYPIAVFALAASAALDAAHVATSIDWVPRYGLRWSVLVDGWSLLLTLLISGIGALVVLYGGAYLRHHPHLGRFYLYLLGFMAAMLGVVLASNLLLLFVCWELTSIFSYLLIGFEHENAKARKSALQALLTTGVGGLGLLVACILLWRAFGTWELADILQQPVRWADGAQSALPIVLVIFLAAFTKSAQFPFHYWLPAAMAAPTPVSAYLHSATMVKAGVVLLARLNPLFHDFWLWQPALLTVGGATMALGALSALPQRDLKLLLAYSTVSALGTLVFLLGVGSTEAIAACVVFLVAHAFYKGGLFFFAGIVDHEAGTRNIDELGGLAKHWPALAFAASLLALSMAGVVPFFGFIAKELAYHAVLHASRPPALALLVLCSALQVAVAGFAVVRPLFFRSPAGRHAPHRPEVELALGPYLLAATSILASLIPWPAFSRLLEHAAGQIAGSPLELKLALWHGWTPVLALSFLTVLLGVVAFFLRNLWCAVARRGRALVGVGPAAVYDASLAGLARLAAWQTGVLQTGKLRQYQALVLVTAVCTVLLAAVLADWGHLHFRWQKLFPTEAAVIVAMIAGLATTIFTPSRLTAIAGLGVTGYAVGVFFLIFGAPDLAMTQFAIETLTVILFVLVLYRLPRFQSRSTPAVRLRDAALSLAVGGGVALVVLVLLADPAPSVLAPFFLANSVPAAHGHNVVNVILVDFRSLDTLGEITVLGLAAVGVGTLMAMWGRYR